MKNLTVVIPAKEEESSLPIVLNEVKDFDCSIIIILEETDKATIEAIKDFIIGLSLIIIGVLMVNLMSKFNI